MSNKTDEGSGKYPIAIKKVQRWKKVYDSQVLQEWILDNFESSKMHDKFFDALKEECKFVDEDEVNKIFDNLVASGG